MIHIYTDASHNDIAEIGYWAYVLVNDNGKIIGQGSGTSLEMKTSQEAEIQAIIMGVFAFMLQCRFPQTFIVWTDELSVAQMWRNRHEKTERVHEVFAMAKSHCHLNYIPRCSDRYSTLADELAGLERRNG